MSSCYWQSEKEDTVMLFRAKITLTPLWRIDESCDFLGGSSSSSSLHFITQKFHRPAKCGGHKQCGCGDMFLICHLILQDHMIKRSCDFMSRSPSILNVSHHLAKFGGHTHCGREDIMDLVCHVALQDRETKESRDLWGDNSLW